MLDTRTGNFEDRQVVYEGEVVLAEQPDKSTLDAPNLRTKDELTPQQGKNITFYTIQF